MLLYPRNTSVRRPIIHNDHGDFHCALKQAVQTVLQKMFSVIVRYYHGRFHPPILLLMFPVFAVRARESLRARIACLRSNKAACRGALYLRLTPADPIKSHTLPLSLLYKIPYSFEGSLFPALPSEAPGRLF